jgi:hypothetical protein
VFLTALLDLVDFLDSIDCLRPQFAVVFCGNVAALLELEAWIDCELFAGEFAVNLRPLCLAGILLSVERFPALLSAESELLERRRKFTMSISHEIFKTKTENSLCSRFSRTAFRVQGKPCWNRSSKSQFSC